MLRRNALPFVLCRLPPGSTACLDGSVQMCFVASCCDFNVNRQTSFALAAAFLSLAAAFSIVIDIPERLVPRSCQPSLPFSSAIDRPERLVPLVSGLHSVIRLIDADVFCRPARPLNRLSSSVRLRLRGSLGR